MGELTEVPLEQKKTDNHSPKIGITYDHEVNIHRCNIGDQFAWSERVGFDPVNYWLPK